jgi:hypothetical protein
MIKLVANDDWSGHQIYLQDYKNIDEFIAIAYELNYNSARSLYLFIAGEYYLLDCIEEIKYLIS